MSRPALLPERPWQWALLAAVPFALAYFCTYFNESERQLSVDFAWLVAVVAFAAALWRPDEVREQRMSQPYWLYAIYFCALALFATNWRWAMTADTLTWLVGGVDLAERGPPGSFLSANGADNFGYLQMAIHDSFMVLFAPTLFWHRAGQIAIGACAMAAVYTVFARIVSPAFGVLVAICASTTSVWLVYTYASYPFIDGIAIAYTMVAVGLWVRRHPDSRRAWLTLGFLSGLMLYATPNSWFMGACVWVWLGPQALFRRGWRLANPIAAGLLGIVTGLPMPIQWSHGGGGQLFSLVQNPNWTQEKVLAFLLEAATIPFDSALQGAGAFGPQLPPGFRWLFLPGILLTPILARWFPGARLIASIYAVQVVILAFSQGPYAGVSVKRALMLIPMATYFCFLPFHRLLRSLWVVLPIAAVWASFGYQDVAYKMQPGRTGYTLLDGTIEAHQRFDEGPVCLYITQRDFAYFFEPDTPVDRLYGLSPRLQMVLDPADPACRTTLCYSPQIDSLDFLELGYAEIEMQATVELRCAHKVMCGIDDEAPAIP